MNVLHIIPAFYPATYWGGPIYSVYALCNAFAQISSAKQKILTSDAAGPGISDSVKVASFPMKYPAGYEVFFCRRLLGASLSPSMIMRLPSMIQWADVVHLTAVYSPSTIPTLLICQVLDKPLVWSPRGALQQWEGVTKRRLKIAWDKICNALLNKTNCIMHVTSKQEGHESRTRIANARVAIIPNGVDVPETLPPREWLPGGKLRLLYLGRLHLKKGIENLVQAVKILNDETVSLKICGSGDEAYSRALKNFVLQHGLERQVSFQGEIEDKDKMNAFMQADICVVPSFTENFGMVVAESLAHGVPVIASRGTPWSDVEKHGCGFWVDNSSEALAGAVVRIKGQQLAEMGRRGREWMKRDFSWNSVAAEMLGVYEGLIERCKTQ